MRKQWSVHWRTVRGFGRMSTSSTSYLVDSSVLVPFLKQDAVISQKLANLANFYISSIALGELYYGAERSAHVERNLAEVDKLASATSLLTVNGETAKRYSLLRRMQEMKGRMLPDNDLWIAATAFQYGLTLVTRDRHF